MTLNRILYNNLQVNKMDNMHPANFLHMYMCQTVHPLGLLLSLQLQTANIALIMITRFYNDCIKDTEYCAYQHALEQLKIWDFLVLVTLQTTYHLIRCQESFQTI